MNVMSAMIWNTRSASRLLFLLSIAMILHFLSLAAIAGGRKTSTTSALVDWEESFEKPSTKLRQTQNHTNVVILLADNLAYDDVGIFQGAHTANGNVQLRDLQTKGSRTPNLDRFALEGRRFLNWNSPAVLCSASRAALLTGA